MSNWKKGIPVLMLLAIPVISTGCAVRAGVGYRVYDPDRHEYHVWDTHERVYYDQWLFETHRKPHHDFRRLKQDDQREYWRWRHDHDQDHDRDDRR